MVSSFTTAMLNGKEIPKIDTIYPDIKEKEEVHKEEPVLTKEYIKQQQSIYLEQFKMAAELHNKQFEQKQKNREKLNGTREISG